MTLVVLLAALFAHLSSAVQSPHGEQHNTNWEGESFNWTQIQPSTSLKWQRCYVSYECTRLEVPLDWTNSSNKNKVILALTKVPAAVSRDDPSFGGTVLINPGGPSGSGVDEMRWLGYGLRNIIDSDKKFDVLSWDPRGVQYTTPSVACFGDDWVRQIWSFKNWAVGLLDSSDVAFDVKWAASESFGKLCETTNTGVYPDGSNIRQFVTTALTARDMIAIIDALQKEKEDHFVLKSQYQRPLPKPSSTPALLNYWGLSYGTYLGNTFASMFPDRIGRMILDGNVDAEDYSRTGWLTNLYDNNKTVDWFFHSCFEAGARCAFNDNKVASEEDLKVKMAQLLQRLRHNPIPAVYDHTSDVVSHADLARLMHGASYAPYYHWKDLAQVAADLYKGNATSILKYLQHLELPQIPKVHMSDRHDGDYKYRTRPGPPGYPQNVEAARAILCGDGDSLDETTKHDWKQRLSILNGQSPIVGPLWAEIPFLCQHWPKSLRPTIRIADPVTPVRNAFKNAAAHEGAQVLTQNSPGHCSGYVNPSNCTFEAVKRFFSIGKLPEEGTVCEGFRNPFLL